MVAGVSCLRGAPYIFVARSAPSPLYCHGSKSRGKEVCLGRPICISALSNSQFLDRWSTYHTISRTNTREVDLVDELDRWWLVWVLITAVHLERVDPILVHALQR